MRNRNIILPLHIICVGALGLWLAFAPHAFAQDLQTFEASEPEFTQVTLPDETVFSEDQPVMLTADQMDYQQKENTVVARGKVEVVQGGSILLADEILYDRAHNKVTARGNVSVLEKNGNVIFAQELELSDNMRRGAIAQFKARMSDDSLFAAGRAVKMDENITELDNVVYSPCKVECAVEGEEGDDPLWQLRADHVKVDMAEQSITYDNAQMELYGVPILYTPYLSHATPNADGKSGLMAPEFGRDDNLGNIYRMPVYYAIAPDKDMIITPIFTSHEGLLLRDRYRQKFDAGDLNIDTSITNPKARDSAGNPIAGKNWRGHFFADGEFDIDDKTLWGFNVKRTSDDTYMRKYKIDGNTLLTSRVYGEKYQLLESSQRNQLDAEITSFQGLTAQDDSSRLPLIFPLIGFNYESDPAANGARYFVDSSALMLSRDVGSKTRRLSNTVGWTLPVISEGGQMIDFKAQLRGDIYDVNDVTLSSGRQFDGVTGRLVPEISALWHYPFIHSFDNGSAIIEPVVGLAVSPSGGNTERIPNEDSLVPEFTDNNLFSDNRFAGYDRIEHGPRVSYGLRSHMNVDAMYFEGLFGQHYRMHEDINFPFSSDVSDHLSDYVGRVGMQYNPFYVAYRFRLNKETLDPLRQEIDFNYQGERAHLGLNYLSLRNDPIFAAREEVYAIGGVDLSKNWVYNMATRYDMRVDQITSVGSELVFKNECVNVSTVVRREYTRDREVKPTTDYLVQLTLKNLN